MLEVFIIIFFVSSLIGLKKPIIGSIAGGFIAAVMYYIFENMNVLHFVLYIIFGLTAGYVCPVALRWFFSGFRGGRGKSAPGVTYFHLGGFGTARSGRYFGDNPSGIVPKHDEEVEWIKNKHIAEIRWFKIGLRYVLAPIICVILLLLGLAYL